MANNFLARPRYRQLVQYRYALVHNTDFSLYATFNYQYRVKRDTIQACNAVKVKKKIMIFL